MSDSLGDRLLPPKCTNLNDWITMWCFIGAGVLLVVWLVSMVLLPEYTDRIVIAFSAIASFAIGRVSIIIAPTRSTNRK